MGHITDIPLIRTLSILWGPGKIEHRPSIASLWRNLSSGTPPKFFSTILCFVALVYKKNRDKVYLAMFLYFLLASVKGDKRGRGLEGDC